MKRIFFGVLCLTTSSLFGVVIHNHTPINLKISECTYEKGHDSPDSREMDIRAGGNIKHDHVVSFVVVANNQSVLEVAELNNKSVVKIFQKLDDNFFCTHETLDGDQCTECCCSLF